MNVTPGDYANIISDREKLGWTIYLGSFLFHQLNGDEAAVQRQQARVVEAAYRRFLTRVVRRPTAISQRDRLPIWLCFPDFPVHKHDKIVGRAAFVNDGQHSHPIIAMPPDGRHVWEVDAHFRNRGDLYVRPGGLSRVHAERVTHDLPDVLDYVWKSIARNRVSQEAILILPRALSEVRREANPVGRNCSIYAEDATRSR